ncbi:MAG: hypothetical protein JO301_13965 [Chitinophagaceae bacterium]|nr:hypothetical protein [Chitinophagaceae bacterium]
MINLFLTYIVPGSVFFPILVFLLHRKTATGALVLLFGYLVMSAIVNITAVVLATLHHRNLWLLHVYTVLETVILLLFFIRLIPARRAKTVVWSLMILFPVACIVNWLFLQNSSNFNTYTRSIEAIIIIGVSAYCWVSSSAETVRMRWTDNPVNWVISGLLLYFASALFLFLFSNYLLANTQTKADDPIWDIVWVTHGFLLVIMYILFGIGFIKSKNAR